MITRAERYARAALVLLSFSASCTATAGEVRLSSGTGGSYRIPVLSWSEIPFRSVVRQQFDFSCGSAAVATLLSYHHGMPTPESDAFAVMWEAGNQDEIRKSGFSMLDLKNYLISRGYRAEAYRLSVQQLGMVAQPGIVLIDLNGYKHFVVLKGMRADRVLVGDPMLGISEYSVADFAKIWNGVLLTAANQDKEFLFNLASDWGPWSTAPLEQAALHVPVASLTDHLHMDYQVTSEYLVNIRGRAD